MKLHKNYLVGKNRTAFLPTPTPGLMGSDLPSDFEQQVLLAVWRLDGDAYGTTVRDELERRTLRPVSQGAVYTTLIRLEKKGLLRSRMADPTPVRGGKAKRFFGITPEGRAGVEAARAAMDRLWDGLAEGEAGEVRG